MFWDRVSTNAVYQGVELVREMKIRKGRHNSWAATNFDREECRDERKSEERFLDKGSRVEKMKQVRDTGSK